MKNICFISYEETKLQIAFFALLVGPMRRRGIRYDWVLNFGRLYINSENITEDTPILDNITQISFYRNSERLNQARKALVYETINGMDDTVLRKEYLEEEEYLVECIQSIFAWITSRRVGECDYLNEIYKEFEDGKLWMGRTAFK